MDNLGIGHFATVNFIAGDMVFPVRILVPTTGRVEMLRRLLVPWVGAAVEWAGIEIVIVVNGAGADHFALPPEMVGDLPIVLRRSPVPCKSHALNLAIEECPDAFIVFYDDDVRGDTRAIRQYVEAGRHYGRGHYFGGSVRPEYSGEIEARLLPFVPSCTKGLYRGDCEYTEDFAFFLGHNWAAFAKDIIDVGGFDERLGPGKATFVQGGDESDLQMRLSKNGCKAVYLPECSASHYVNTDRVTIRWSLAKAYAKGTSEALFKLPALSLGSVARKLIGNLIFIFIWPIPFQLISALFGRANFFDVLHRVAYRWGRIAGICRNPRYHKTPRRIKQIP